MVFGSSLACPCHTIHSADQQHWKKRPSQDSGSSRPSIVALQVATELASDLVEKAMSSPKLVDKRCADNNFVDLAAAYSDGRCQGAVVWKEVSETSLASQYLQKRLNFILQKQEEHGGSSQRSPTWQKTSTAVSSSSQSSPPVTSVRQSEVVAQEGHVMQESQQLISGSACGGEERLTRSQSLPDSPKVLRAMLLQDSDGQDDTGPAPSGTSMAASNVPDVSRRPSKSFVQKVTTAVAGSTARLLGKHGFRRASTFSW